MKVLVLGNGGREHALVWKLRQSPRVSKLYCAPGNGGIEDEAECLPVDLKSLDSIVALGERIRPDLTVVGPELPLTLGVVDEFTRRGWPAFGPTKAAAQLEASKSLQKNFCSGIIFLRLLMRCAIRLTRCARRSRIFTCQSW